jgi:hypothetical protein
MMLRVEMRFDGGDVMTRWKLRGWTPCGVLLLALKREGPIGVASEVVGVAHLRGMVGKLQRTRCKGGSRVVRPSCWMVSE